MAARLTEMLLLVGLAVTVSVPVLLPLVEAVKPTTTVQLVPAFSVKAVRAQVPVDSIVNGPLEAMLVICTLLVPAVRVTVRVMRLPFTTEPRSTALLGASVVSAGGGVLPVPLSTTAAGAVTMLDVSVRLPVTAPVAAGVKRSVTVQVPAAAIAALVQVVATCENTGLEILICVMVSGALPLLVMVRVVLAELWPTATDPKLKGLAL